MAAERSGGCRPFAVVQAPCLRTQERIQPRTCWDLAEFSRRSSQGCRIRDRNWLGRWQFLRSAVPRPASGLRPSASKRTQGRRGGARRSGPPSQVSGLTFSLPCFGGYGFYLLKSKPVFLWNLVDLKRERWEGPALAPGKHLIGFEFRYAGLGSGTTAFGSYSGVGQGGTGVLKVDGEEVATKQMTRVQPRPLYPVAGASSGCGSDPGGYRDTNARSRLVRLAKHGGGLGPRRCPGRRTDRGSPAPGGRAADQHHPAQLQQRGRRRDREPRGERLSRARERLVYGLVQPCRPRSGDAIVGLRERGDVSGRPDPPRRSPEQRRIVSAESRPPSGSPSRTSSGIPNGPAASPSRTSTPGRSR